MRLLIKGKPVVMVGQTENTLVRVGDVNKEAEAKAEVVMKSAIKTEKRRKSGKPKQFVYKKPAPLPVTNCSQPLILATASDWVVPGSVMRESIYNASLFLVLFNY